MRRWQARRQLDAIGVTAYYLGYPAEALPPHYDELLNLYRVVMQRKPTVVMELGGGYSTFVIAHAVAELSRQGIPAKLYAIDESDYWQRVVIDRFPSCLRPFVHFQHCPLERRTFDDATVAAFVGLPVNSTNLLYVDGGLLDREHGLPKAKVNISPLDFEEYAPPDFAILVDGRKTTVEFLRKHLKHSYQVGPGPCGVQTLFTRITKASAA